MRRPTPENCNLRSNSSSATAVNIRVHVAAYHERTMVAAQPNSFLWRWTMAFTGVGSTMLGPLLPHLLPFWRIHDHEGGMLVASLFLGSFSGTLAMSERLERCLRRG